MKECADLYSTIKAAYKGQGFSISTHKSTFHEEVGLLTDILEELCPQEGQGEMNSYHVSFPGCTKSAILFPATCRLSICLWEIVEKSLQLREGGDTANGLWLVV